MSKELTFMNGKALAGNLDDFKEASSNLTQGGGSGGGRRISILGSRFRKMVDGEQVEVSDSNAMNVVIVNAAPISRTYYEGDYDPDKIAAPVCWSKDTRTPAADVPEDTKQSSRCGDCPQNIKGSGQGKSRACRYSQRVAVAIEGDYETIYQLSLPATSIFGDAIGGNMPMAAYAKYLAEHGAPASAIVTEMRFDSEAAVPKLFFKPVRPLEEDELALVRGKLKSEDTLRAIALEVAQTDKVESAPPFSELPHAKKEEEAAPEPKKAKKATAPDPVPEEDIGAVVDEWDD